MGRGGRLDAPGAEHADSRRRTGTRDGGRPLERRGQGRPRLDRPTEEVGDPATDGAPVSRATRGVSLGMEAVRPNKIDPSSPDSRVCESHQACCPAHPCRFFLPRGHRNPPRDLGRALRQRDATLYALGPAGSAPKAAAATPERALPNRVPGDRGVAEPSVRLRAASSSTPVQPRPLPIAAVAG